MFVSDSQVGTLRHRDKVTWLLGTELGLGRRQFNFRACENETTFTQLKERRALFRSSLSQSDPVYCQCLVRLIMFNRRGKWPICECQASSYNIDAMQLVSVWPGRVPVLKERGNKPVNCISVDQNGSLKDSDKVHHDSTPYWLCNLA